MQRFLWIYIHFKCYPFYKTLFTPWHCGEKVSLTAIYVGKLPIRPQCLVLFVALNTWLGWKSIKLYIGFVYLRLFTAGLDCFQLGYISKLFCLKRDSNVQAIYCEDVFLVGTFQKKYVVFFCRCCVSFMSGWVWQPWSRSSSVAVASSSMDPLWAYSSCRPPSALTPAPRGQRLQGNTLAATFFTFFLPHNKHYKCSNMIKSVWNIFKQISQGSIVH